jgi:hypothetical protein
MLPSHPTESRRLAVVQAQNELVTARLEKGPVLMRWPGNTPGETLANLRM